MVVEFPEKLTEDLYFKLMTEIGADPQWATSHGKRVLLLTGLCHHSNSGHHSVIFDCSDIGEQKVTCMSECGDTKYWWNYLARALRLTSYEAKEWVIDWLNGKKVEVELLESLDFNRPTYEEKAFDPNPLEMVPGIGREVEKDLYKKFESGKSILEDCLWHKEDGIDVDILQLYDVAIYPDHDTIILPHHNINGEIVGLYERNFNILRRDAKILYPDMPYKMLLEYPRAKYVPLLKEGKYKPKEDSNEKTSWSFPNARNLYGLHLAKNRISKTGVAIIFEGAKSVMLARQWGYDMCVASHTFGANENQIAMLLAEGATDIYFAFDKQYKDGDSNRKEWELYDKKTRNLADRIKDYCNVYRIRDIEGLLDYKDSPVDKGEAIFDKLFNSAEPLAIDCILLDPVESPLDKTKVQFTLDEISKKRKALKSSFEDELKYGAYLTEEQVSFFERMENLI